MLGFALSQAALGVESPKCAEFTETRAAHDFVQKLSSKTDAEFESGTLWADKARDRLLFSICHS
jgi:hypothetical protein